MPFCSPDKIVIGERFRTADLNDPAVKEMAESIKECGQLQPVLVTKEMELVDGLHRLLACKSLGKDVWWADETEAKLLFENPAQRRRAELQANIKRKEFTPLQLSLGIAELDRLMRETYGERKSGPNLGKDDGWGQTDTAKMLGYKSHASISDALTVAKAVEAGAIPALAQAKTMNEAVKMVKDKMRLEASVELARRQGLVSSSEIANPRTFFEEKIILGSCLDGMKKLPPSICSLFITDPPFAVNFDKVIASRIEGQSKVQGVYSDNPADILPLLHGVINEMARVGKPSCQVVMFCGSQYWHVLANWFNEAGFSTLNKPILWVKAKKEPFTLCPGRTSQPAILPSSAYEPAVLAWRGQAVLAQQGQPDVFVHPVVSYAKKFHPAQKPISLLTEIIERFHHPSTQPLLIDPFAGSGSTLVAARRVGLTQYFGYELDPKNRERAVAYLINSYVEDLQKEKEVDEVDLDDVDLDD